MKKFGKKLKECRKQLSINQTTLGNMVGLSQDIISLYEKGTSEPSQDVLIAFSKIFNVTTDYLLGLEDENQALSKNISNTEFNLSVGKASGTIENFNLNHKIKK